MTDQELEELLKVDTDKILYVYFKRFVEPQFDALHKSMSSIIEVLDRITTKVDRITDMLDQQ